ncbi:hypothetical protein OJAV_G00116160 [Oryzias javanicus]|uniref:Uncharacterized protein n=1 Tax=Oryzias javanicus TaxID=123683 RepID=A0A437CT26_ORYJA|nr:hypothetical protein OJAV_G00116160 [Oryzias javanicus]
MFVKQCDLFKELFLQFCSSHWRLFLHTVRSFHFLLLNPRKSTEASASSSILQQSAGPFQTLTSGSIASEQLHSSGSSKTSF